MREAFQLPSRYLSRKASQVRSFVSKINPGNDERRKRKILGEKVKILKVLPADSTRIAAEGFDSGIGMGL